jgi:hypothetical protein
MRRARCFAPKWDGRFARGDTLPTQQWSIMAKFGHSQDQVMELVVQRIGYLTKLHNQRRSG